MRGWWVSSEIETVPEENFLWLILLGNGLLMITFMYDDCHRHMHPNLGQVGARQGGNYHEEALRARCSAAEREEILSSKYM